MNMFITRNRQCLLFVRRFKATISSSTRIQSRSVPAGSAVLYKGEFRKKLESNWEIL